MNVLVFAARTAQQLRGAIGDDLVAVHVKADARAGLEDVDGEVLVPFAALHLFGGIDDCAGGFVVDQPELAIGHCRRFLHHGDSADQRAMRVLAADGKVLHGTGRLDAVINVAGNFFVAERILLDARRLLIIWHKHLWD